MKKSALYLGFLIILLLSGNAFAILPEVTSGTGGYYVIPFGIAYIMAIYNNTQICTDNDNNFVCSPSEISTIDSAQYITTTAKTIFTDKPVAGNLRVYCAGGYPGYMAHLYLPSSSEVRKKYIVFSDYSPLTDIVALEPKTNVTLFYPNGTFMNYYLLAAPARYVELSGLAAGTVIESDKPVFVFQRKYYGGGYRYAFAFQSFDPGTEFYTDTKANYIRILPLINVTNVSVDTNRDGIPDYTYTLYLGNELTLSGLTIGSRISSDAPVYAANIYATTADYYYAWAYTFLNSSYLGNEYVIPPMACYGTRYVYINPIQYKTTVNIYNPDGSLSSTHELLAPSDYLTLTNPAAGTRISSDKPVLVNSHLHYVSGALTGKSSYLLRPLSPSTIIKPPEIMATNEYATIKVRFFNPSSENLYNISLNISAHKNFTLVGGVGVVNVTIYKKDAHTDDVISSDFVQKSYTLSGDEKFFVVSYSDSTLLSSLSKDEYIEIVFDVIANYPGYYTFKAESSWKATHYV